MFGIQETNASQDLIDRIFQLAQKSRNAPKPKSYSKQADFLVYSQKLEQEIKKATATFNKLNELTSRMTRFNMEDTKITELTNNVKESISNIQKKILYLQSNNDLISSRQAEKMAKNILEILNLRFVELTKNFKGTLETRTKAIKQNQEKETSSSFFSMAGSNSSEIRSRKTIKKEAAFIKKGKAYDPEEGAGGYNEEYAGQHPTTTQQSYNLEALKNKRESARGVQKTLEEVMGIFQRISTMVQMHDVMIQRIDKDTDDSLRNIEDGKKRLVNIYKDLSGMRKLIISIFIFMLLFATVYILII